MDESRPVFMKRWGGIIKTAHVPPPTPKSPMHMYCARDRRPGLRVSKGYGRGLLRLLV